MNDAPAFPLAIPPNPGIIRNEQMNRSRVIRHNPDRAWYGGGGGMKIKSRPFRENEKEN